MVDGECLTYPSESCPVEKKSLGSEVTIDELPSGEVADNELPHEIPCDEQLHGELPHGELPGLMVNCSWE